MQNNNNNYQSSDMTKDYLTQIAQNQQRFETQLADQINNNNFDKLMENMRILKHDLTAAKINMEELEKIINNAQNCDCIIKLSCIVSGFCHIVQENIELHDRVNMRENVQKLINELIANISNNPITYFDVTIDDHNKKFANDIKKHVSSIANEYSVELGLIEMDCAADELLAREYAQSIDTIEMDCTDDEMFAIQLAFS